jgi:5-methylcytosine-specific restriction enzyme subunit McrC
LTEAFRRYDGWCRDKTVTTWIDDDEILMKPDLVWYRDGSRAPSSARMQGREAGWVSGCRPVPMLAYCAALELRDGHLVYAKGNADEVGYDVLHAGVRIPAHTLDLGHDARHLLARIDALAERFARTAGNLYEEVGRL